MKFKIHNYQMNKSKNLNLRLKKMYLKDKRKSLIGIRYAQDTFLFNPTEQFKQPTYFLIML